jgi:hypothetical protein
MSFLVVDKTTISVGGDLNLSYKDRSENAANWPVNLLVYSDDSGHPFRFIPASDSEGGHF